MESPVQLSLLPPSPALKPEPTASPLPPPARAPAAPSPPPAPALRAPRWPLEAPSPPPSPLLASCSSDAGVPATPGGHGQQPGRGWFIRDTGLAGSGTPRSPHTYSRRENGGLFRMDEPPTPGHRRSGLRAVQAQQPPLRCALAAAEEAFGALAPAGGAFTEPLPAARPLPPTPALFSAPTLADAPVADGAVLPTASREASEPEASAPLLALGTTLDDPTPWAAIEDSEPSPPPPALALSVTRLLSTIDPEPSRSPAATSLLAPEPPATPDPNDSP